MASRYDKYLPGNAPVPPDTRPVPPVVAAPPLPPGGEVKRSRYDKYVGPSSAAPVPVPPGGINWAGMGKPYGEIKSHEWSPTERMAHDVQDTLMAGGMDAYNARHFGEGAINIGRLNPIANLVTSGADLGYHLPRGEYAKSAFDALGVLPAAIYGSKFVRGQTPVRNADVPRSVFDKSYLPERQLFGKPDQYGMRPGGGYGPALPSSTTPKDELKVAGQQGYNRVAASPVLWHPTALNDYIYKTVDDLRRYGAHGIPHTPENSPEFYAAMTRWYNNHVGRATPVTAMEFENLRQELRALPGGTGSGVAGGKAANLLDEYQLNSPPGMVVQGTQQQLDALRSNIEDARGNWRSYKTAETVEQGIVDAKNSAAVKRQDQGQAVQNVLDHYANTPAGRDAIFGATRNELATIGQAAQGTTGNRVLNTVGDALSTGKAAGAGALAGGSLGGILGLDYLSSAGLASLGAGVPPVLGGGLRWGAQPGMARSAQDALDAIRMNSPLYRQRALPASQPPPAGFTGYGGSLPPPSGAPIDNPNIMARDAITYALIPQIQKKGEDVWAGADAPFEDRKPIVPPAPQRIIIDQPAESYDPELEKQ